MSMIKGVAARLRAIIRPAEADRDLDDQIALHLDLETEKYLRQGFAPDEARRRAVLAFGGVQQTREEHRETRTGRWLEETRRDVRIALRGLARRPAMTAAATLTLALGLGAVTALFSVVDAVILRPLPFPQPDRLVMLWEENPDRGWHQQSAAPANMLDWRERVRSLAAIGAYADFGTTTTLTGVGEPRLLHAAMVTGNLFDVLGVHPLHGRTFTEEETWSTAERVVMLSHATWRNIFGADTSLVGRTITLGGNPWRVAGIMPATFAFPRDDVEIWVPMRWNPASSTQIGFRRAHWMRPVARLAPGVTPQRANAELRDVAARMMEEYPETNTRMGAGLTPLHEFLIGNTRTPLLILLGATAILLALACVNVGNLLLGAAAEREREMALRLVLGAGRMRLVRQTITESLVLAGVGGVAGVALGWIGTRVLSAMQPDGLLRVRDVPMDWRVLAFAVAVTTVCGLVFALAPALWSGRRQPSDALREGGRTGSAGQRARRWGSTIVVAEVALALVLTVGAGLLVRSYWMLMRVHPGFDGRGVVTASLVLPGSRYDTGEKVDAF